MYYSGVSGSSYAIGYNTGTLPERPAVGGVITPVDGLAVLAPYLALAALVSAASIIIAHHKKPES